MHDWQLSSSVLLHNTLFYYAGNGFFDYDASWADTSMLRIGYNYGIPTNQNPTNTIVEATVENRQWGWLPRVEIDHGGGEVAIGGELRIHRSLHHGTILYAEGLPANYDPDYGFYEYTGKKDIASLFAHELLRPQDDLAVMIDLQLVYNRYEIADEKYVGTSFGIPYWFLIRGPG